jgi:hypothetical protein
MQIKILKRKVVLQNAELNTIELVWDELNQRIRK